ncbi:class I SAM-dependent methyltransferase [Paraburkholderia saeva]|uniref:class I SAM-dependent methyltransferase n=1 Tax=Paraburkholderia saeva TaxID=2777537 RepID=UPI001DB64495|nr:class I SAM-dependent methyltransferase [Paraburkholderia saeva]CAG4885509.1 Trans-aconitate 2-methyltransferase [Paraburkholderia saeva]
MKETEFDRFADEYRATHAANISASGEAPEFFAEYKIADAAHYASAANLSPESIIDFGCGVGNSIPYFRKYFRTSKLVAADVSRKSLDLAAKRFNGEADFFALQGNSIDLPNASFDMLFSACVFHHIPHEEHVHWLSELRRIARPNAMLVIFEHNPWNPLTVRAVNTCEFDENAHLVTPFALEKSIKKAGWSTTRHEYRIFFPKSLAFLRPLEKHMKWLPLGAQHAVIARA